MNKIIVFDSDHHGAANNRCFQPSYANEGPGHQFTVELATQAQASGFEPMTADVFLQRSFDGAITALCITDMVSKNTDRLLKRNAIPFLCYSFESPMIAWNFYLNIKKLAGRFHYNIQFGGTRDRLEKTSTRFETMHFPVSSRVPLSSDTRWSTRKFLILVNSNKRVFRTDYSSFGSGVRSALSELKLSTLRVVDPWLRSKEIYKDRIEMIYHFSKFQDFDLYGVGWENKIRGFSNDYQQAALKSFRGKLGYENKLKTMSEYKFNICFENCAFPGYVTEKIFDTFLSGSIPVYFGAPDISDFVPADTYIDFRKFPNLSALEEYLVSVTEEEARGYIHAAQRFLQSNLFDRHDLKTFVKGIIDKAQTLA